jgi:starch phosphorylase
MTADTEVRTRTGMTVDAFKRAFLDNLAYLQGSDLTFASRNDLYLALAYTVRDRLVRSWLDTIHAYAETRTKIVYYLSAEYLLGRQLENNLLAADGEAVAREALAELGLDFDELREYEAEPGLGNGGLGRLAACFLDSLATLGMPAVGYGIRYEYGIFKQAFQDGWQIEQPDEWLLRGDPWAVPHHAMEVKVGFGGRTESYVDEHGSYRVRWLPAYTVLGVPYNIMVPGYQNGTVNTLRLWSARASEEFNLGVFNAGDYISAVHDKTVSENISKVLYPEDSTPQGKELRLQQQYFFVACSLADVLRVHPTNNDEWERLPERIVMQLNDTHPTVAVPELMRLLLDVHGLNWERAWAITTRVFAYTCHTLLPEALEKWSVDLFARLLPRHLEIIYEINRRFLDEVRVRFPNEEDRVRRMSLIEEGPERRVRMAYLASVGGFSINGVAALHSELLKQTVLHDFFEMYPAKFNNKTNGVTPRRFMRLANPKLTELLNDRLGTGWVNNLDELKRLEALADDASFRAEWRAVKQANKQVLADVLQKNFGVAINPDSIYDVIVKRLHEYKRQLLKAMHIIVLYNRIKADPGIDIVPRTFIFGAKAAPGYRMAKLIIKLINSVAEVVNNDPDVRGRLNVVYIPNFNVSLGERIYPAADISEQISMAGKEASGTGNMKFSLNGALTVGTLDGANVEIRELVGPENFFLFGLTTDEVFATKAAGYNPYHFYETNPVLKQVIDQIGDGVFSRGDSALFQPIVQTLLGSDPFMHCADFQGYIEAQDAAEAVYRDQERWTHMSILNTARCGFFSSDRSMRQYCADIWQVSPVAVSTQRSNGRALAGVLPTLSLTTDERELFRRTAAMIGVATMYSAESGPVGRMAETAAVVTVLAEASQRFGSDGAVQRSVSEKGLSIDVELGEQYDFSKASEISRLAEDTLSACRNVAEVLHSKHNPQQIREAKRWFLAIGERVANASSEGGFLGLVGSKISPAEERLLREISVALGAL